LRHDPGVLAADERRPLTNRRIRGGARLEGLFKVIEDLSAPPTMLG
jgi:hypothetical protein